MRIMVHQLYLLTTAAVTVLIGWPHYVQTAHFRGGTISWKSLGGLKVRFFTKLGWRFEEGCGCTARVCNKDLDYRICWEGCNEEVKITDVNYKCIGQNKEQNWELGQKEFDYTFPNEGPFTVGYRRDAWLALSNGKGLNRSKPNGGEGTGYWSIDTVVSLRRRSDTGEINSSPVSLSKPTYSVQYDCNIRIRVPVIDPDGDPTRCRWAKGKECVSVCNALNGAKLDPETCTLTFNTTKSEGYIEKGYYAAAIMIEDFPRTPITMGSSTKRSMDPLSSVALQFVVKTVPRVNGDCNVPRFVSPTPKDNEVMTVEDGDLLKVILSADNGNDPSTKISKIDAASTMALNLTPLTQDSLRINTFTRTLTWTPSRTDLGENIICVIVENEAKLSGDQRCFTVNVVQRGCRPNPCKNGGRCSSNTGSPVLGKHVCSCRPGYTGNDCEIDIDECNPCPGSHMCVDGINKYTCVKRPTTTSTTSTSSMTPPTTFYSRYNQKNACPREYESCECVINPKEDTEGRKELLSTDHEVWALLVFIPYGLALSYLTLGPTCRLRNHLTEKIRSFRSERKLLKDETSSTRENKSFKEFVFLYGKPVQRLKNMIDARTRKRPPCPKPQETTGQNTGYIEGVSPEERR